MTYRDTVVGVVVPAYDEEGFVGDVIEGVPDYVDRVYPVEDRSTDDTWTEIQRAAARVNERRSPTEPYEEVVVPTRHDENRGAGGAIATGYQLALDDDVDVIATMDGDGQMDPAFLPALLDPVIDGAVAYAKGDRLAALDDAEDMSLWRLFGNTLLTALTRIASGYWHLRDPQNGFTAVSAEALDQFDLDELYPRYGFRNDVLVHLSVAGYRIADVSHPARYGEESSDIQYASFVPRLSWLLLQRFGWRLTEQYRRHDERTVLGAFLVGLITFCISSLSGTVSVLSTDTETQTHTASPSSASPPSRTDGGVERSSTGRSNPLLFLVSLLLLGVGAALDIRRRGGRVSRIDGRE